MFANVQYVVVVPKGKEYIQLVFHCITGAELGDLLNTRVEALIDASQEIEASDVPAKSEAQ